MVSKMSQISSWGWKCIIRRYVATCCKANCLFRIFHETLLILISYAAGDTCLDALRIREAGTWYLKAIRKREVPWAIASMCFIDYMMTGHQDYVAELLNASRRSTYHLLKYDGILTRVKVTLCNTNLVYFFGSCKDNFTNINMNR